jgi:hypothetical protein
MYLALQAYTTHVFLDFQLVYDSPEQPYARLAAHLDGRGVPDMNDALRELALQVIHVPYRELLNAGMLRFVYDSGLDEDALMQIEAKSRVLLEAVKRYVAGEQDIEPLLRNIEAGTRALFALSDLFAQYPAPRKRNYKAASAYLAEGFLNNWGTALAWLFTREFGGVMLDENYAQQSREWIDEWLLGKIMAQSFQDLGYRDEDTGRYVALVKLLTANQDWHLKQKVKSSEILRTWFADAEMQAWLKVNRFQNLLWFNKEALQEWVWWMLALAAVKIVQDSKESPGDISDQIATIYTELQNILKVIDASDYQVEKLLALVGKNI